MLEPCLWCSHERTLLWLKVMLCGDTEAGQKKFRQMKSHVRQPPGHRSPWSLSKNPQCAPRKPSIKILPCGGESNSSLLWVREGTKTTERSLWREHCTLTQSCKKELCRFPSPLPHLTQEEEEKRGEVGI